MITARSEAEIVVVSARPGAFPPVNAGVFGGWSQQLFNSRSDTGGHASHLNSLQHPVVATNRSKSGMWCKLNIMIRVYPAKHATPPILHNTGKP